VLGRSFALASNAVSPRDPLAGLRVRYPADAGVPAGAGNALAADDEQEPRSRLLLLDEKRK
jgi:hypothetical protein